MVCFDCISFLGVFWEDYNWRVLFLAGKGDFT